MWGIRALEGMKVLAVANAVAMVQVLILLIPTYLRQHSWGDLAFIGGVIILTLAFAYVMIIGSNFAIRRIRTRQNSN